MIDTKILWELLWKGLAAGDRNGGPIRLATLLHQSLEEQQYFDEKKVFKIVGHEEADIENNLLSYKSPVAKELIGKVKNDFVMVNTPKGEKSYEITAIIYK